MSASVPISLEQYLIVHPSTRSYRPGPALIRGVASRRIDNSTISSPPSSQQKPQQRDFYTSQQSCSPRTTSHNQHLYALCRYKSLRCRESDWEREKDGLNVESSLCPEKVRKIEHGWFWILMVLAGAWKWERKRGTGARKSGRKEQVGGRKGRLTEGVALERDEGPTELREGEWRGSKKKEEEKERASERWEPRKERAPKQESSEGESKRHHSTSHPTSLQNLLHTPNLNHNPHYHPNFPQLSYSASLSYPTAESRDNTRHLLKGYRCYNARWWEDLTPHFLSASCCRWIWNLICLREKQSVQREGGATPDIRTSRVS